jgi:transposase
MTTRRYEVGIDRQQGQLLPPKVDDYIEEANIVRVIDCYIDSLDLDELGFQYASGKLTAGQPAYPPGSLLKLYLYGYINRVRSSRRLERETHRNLEVIWLMQGLRPSYKTIADFRKDNRQALKAVNRNFIQLCEELDLLGGQLVGIDGSYFRGNVSKKNIYTKKRLTPAIERLEKLIEDYLEELEKADEEEAGMESTDKSFQEKLEALRARQKKHH